MRSILYSFLFLLFIVPQTLQAKCVEGNCQNGVGTYNYHIGKVYRGEWKNGEKHGQGIYTYPDGKKYVGGFKAGKKHGYGIETYPDGSKYDGDFRNGKPNGHGTFTDFSGQFFTGEFENGKPVGKDSLVAEQQERNNEKELDTASNSTAIPSEPENISTTELSSPYAVSITGITEVRDIDIHALAQTSRAEEPSGTADTDMSPVFAAVTVQPVPETTDTKSAQMDIVTKSDVVQNATEDLVGQLHSQSVGVVPTEFETAEKQMQGQSAEEAFAGVNDDEHAANKTSSPALAAQPLPDSAETKPEGMQKHPVDGAETAVSVQSDMQSDGLEPSAKSVFEEIDVAAAETVPTAYTLTIDETINVQQKKVSPDDQPEKANMENKEQSGSIGSTPEEQVTSGIGERSGDEYREVLTIPDLHNPEAVAQKRMPDGQGTKIFPDGSKYVGEFKNGMPNGQGVVTTLFGKKYVGEFVNGFPHGQGIFTSPDGEQYVGEFEFGVPHGQGTYTYAGGEQYSGNLQNGIKNGQGASTFLDGSKYIGGWQGGEFHGNGTYTNAAGLKYTGEWKNGRQYGQGTLLLPDGEKYTGEFKKGKPDGLGTITYANGEQFSGEFRHGEPVRSEVTSK